jgi:hypothetical protein
MGKKMKLTILSATMVVSLVTALSAEAKYTHETINNDGYELVCIKTESDGTGVKTESDGTGVKTESDGTGVKTESDGTGVRKYCMINKS